MADAITYADLRFVKAPLKQSLSNWLDSDAYEDGDLTYENVQVPSAPEGPGGVAPAGLGDPAGVQPGPPSAAWSATTSAAAGRVLPRCAASPQVPLLGLLLTCLLLAVAVVCLGVRYAQEAQQLQQRDRALEAANSSLRQQLLAKAAQLGQREEELRGSRAALAQRETALRVAQELRREAEEQVQTCQSDSRQTDEALQRAEGRRAALQRGLSTLRPFFTCQSSETCCPVGWILNKASCYYISVTGRSWEESQKYCKSLSSELARFRDSQHNSVSYREVLPLLLPDRYPYSSYWIGLRYNKTWKWIDGTPFYGFDRRNRYCAKVQIKELTPQSSSCLNDFPCICEMAAFPYPDGEHL